MSEKPDLKNERRDYPGGPFDEKDALQDPFAQFDLWMSQALSFELVDATAMTLATVSPLGQPSARVVLLKGHSEKGFVFFSNYQSKKGKELAENPKASLLFYWREFSRQIRIEGSVTKVSEEESQKYFQSRPRQSQIAAVISEQSGIITDRKTLEEAFNEFEKNLPEHEAVPKPPTWGGWCLTPNLFEFWQGRENRLHDRLEYRIEEQVWHRQRLAP